MTSQELKQVLNMAILGLESNRRLITPKVLDKIEGFINDYGEHPILRTILIDGLGFTNDELDRYSVAALDIVKIQRKLSSTDLTTKLIAGIKELRERPVALAILARLM